MTDAATATYYFFSTAAQCMAAIAGLTTALVLFRYQAMRGQIEDLLDELIIMGEKWFFVSNANRGEYVVLSDSFERTAFLRYFLIKATEGSYPDTLHFARKHLILSSLVVRATHFRRLSLVVTIFGFLVVLGGVLATQIPLHPSWNLPNPKAYYTILSILYLGAVFYLTSVSIEALPKIHPQFPSAPK